MIGVTQRSGLILRRARGISSSRRLVSRWLTSSRGMRGRCRVSLNRLDNGFVSRICLDGFSSGYLSNVGC
jgi:hypothetical protein